MKLIEQHKAAILTFLIAGTLVLGMFSIHIKQHQKLITESYYELEPKDETEEKREELQKTEDPNIASTNKAFNEDQEYKEMMRNFRTVSSDDFERTTNAKEDETITDDTSEPTDFNKSYIDYKEYAINTKESQSYKSLQDELKKRQKNKKQADEHAKSRSTLTYSLKGRTLAHYTTPRYLCERGGKIVVNIRVNEIGNVFDAYINGSSNSNNQCLIDHAIEYAMSVQFDSSNRDDQLGTITFLFKSKN
ncbi:hypothetical protein [Winogradskyella sp.]|uniref:hypothetical protein n=1 Tax=Winogradskyella sp. TaxID=1883156 RepID=UPI003F6BBEF3